MKTNASSEQSAIDKRRSNHIGHSTINFNDAAISSCLFLLLFICTCHQRINYTWRVIFNYFIGANGFPSFLFLGEDHLKKSLLRLITDLSFLDSFDVLDVHAAAAAHIDRWCICYHFFSFFRALHIVISFESHSVSIIL